MLPPLSFSQFCVFGQTLSYFTVGLIKSKIEKGDHRHEMVENARLCVREFDQAGLTREGENIQRETVMGWRQGSYQDDFCFW